MIKLADIDIALLERLAACAARTPCQAPKADLLRLLALAGPPTSLNYVSSTLAEAMGLR